MPKDKAHDKHEEDAILIKKIGELKRSLGLEHIPANTPGASDQELYPAQPGEFFTEFRLAKAKGKKPRGGQGYA